MLDKTIQDWSALATDLQIEGRAFINGRYEDALSGETRETVSPANGQKLADVANCGIEDADKAVETRESRIRKWRLGCDGTSRSKNGVGALGRAHRGSRR